MSENLLLSLQITLVGMGMVFGAIILIWGLMALLVRIAGETEALNWEEGALAELERKRQAAVAAVFVALAQQAHSMEPHEFPLPSTALVSAWQSVMRTRMLNKRGRTR